MSLRFKLDPKFLILTAASLIIPAFIASNSFFVFVFTLIIINSILALSFEVTGGFLGLDNLAIAGLVGFGAYTSVYLVTHSGLPFWIAAPLGGGVAAFIGLALVYPSVRLKGLYFAIGTLILQLLFTQIFINWTSFTGGDIGISNISPPILALGSRSLQLTGVYFAYLCIIIFLIWTLVVSRMKEGPKSSLVLEAIRVNDTLAGFLGIDTTRQKSKYFLISSFAAGVGGYLFAVLQGYISSTVLDLLFSVSLLTMVYVGGRRSTYGPIIGAALLTSIPNIFLSLYTIRNYFSGTLLILFIVLLPTGLYGLFSQLYSRSRRGSKREEVNQQQQKQQELGESD